MTTIIDAKKYINHRINNEKGFGRTMLAELIFKNCDKVKLKTAVDKWMAQNTDTPPSKPPTPPTTAPNNKPAKPKPRTPPALDFSQPRAESEWEHLNK